jgi:Flp pilus assembly protein TadB
MASLAFWNPIAWIISAIAALLIAYFIRSRGEKTYKAGVQREEFMMANPKLSEEQAHIKAHNIYWGFFEAFKQYYDKNTRAHTGIVNDYIIWFVALIALTAIIVLVVGGVNG